MKLIPLGDRVLIRQDEAEETTASGLYLASESKEKPQSGVVVAVGEGKRDKDGNLIPISVKEGDRKVRCHRSGGRRREADADARRGHLREVRRIGIPSIR